MFFSVMVQKIWLRCKISVNIHNSESESISSPEKWYTKVRIIVSNYGNIFFFATEPNFIYQLRNS